MKLHAGAVHDISDLRPLDAERTADEWRALCSGRWSVIDHFEEGGRRYLVASPCTQPALTDRERAVVARVAAGQCNKVIGFDLGLATSTVAGHLASAMRKMGTRSRVELVARWNALPRPARQP